MAAPVQLDPKQKHQVEQDSSELRVNDDQSVVSLSSLAVVVDVESMLFSHLALGILLVAYDRVSKLFDQYLEIFK